MLTFLKRLFQSNHPLARHNLPETVRDVTFRVMEDKDIRGCVEIYSANEAKHFPPGGVESYEVGLRKRDFATLVAWRGGNMVGCCSLAYSVADQGLQVGVFCYGMVAPANQRQGIGTAQLLLRLALLTPAYGYAYAMMYAVPNSVPFYRRFGFEFKTEGPADDGRNYPIGWMNVSEGLIHECKMALEYRQITYPDIRDEIPIRKPEAESRVGQSGRTDSLSSKNSS